jgi:hypothetical protein
LHSIQTNQDVPDDQNVFVAMSANSRDIAVAMRQTQVDAPMSPSRAATSMRGSSSTAPFDDGEDQFNDLPSTARRLFTADSSGQQPQRRTPVKVRKIEYPEGIRGGTRNDRREFRRSLGLSVLGSLKDAVEAVGMEAAAFEERARRFQVSQIVEDDSAVIADSDEEEVLREADAQADQQQTTNLVDMEAVESGTEEEEDNVSPTPSSTPSLRVVDARLLPDPAPVPLSAGNEAAEMHTTPEAVAEENPSTEAATEEAAAENASVAHRTRASARKNVEQDN